MSHVISQVWKYVVLTIDHCLYGLNERYTRLKSRFDTEVEEIIAERMEHYEQD